MGSKIHKAAMDQLSLAQLKGIAYFLDATIERFSHEQEIAEEMDALASALERTGGQSNYCKNVKAGCRQMRAVVVGTIKARERKLQHGNVFT